MIGLILVEVGILVSALFVAFLSIRRDRKRERAEPQNDLILDYGGGQQVVVPFVRMDIPTTGRLSRTGRAHAGRR
jgi:hypothetical protein